MFRDTLLFIVFFTCTLTISISQDTYFKEINLPDQFTASGRIIESDSMDFIINGPAPCIEGLDTFNCMTISRHDQYAEVEWSRKVKWSRSANSRSIVLSNDTVFVSGHTDPFGEENSFNCIFLDKNTGDSLGGFRRVFTENNGSINEGMIKKGNDLFLYGSGLDSQDVRICMIYKYNIQTQSDDLFTYSAESGSYHRSKDATFNAVNNIVIASRINLFQIDPFIQHRIEFLEISQNGELISRAISPGYNDLMIDPLQFTIDQQGNYIYSYVNEENDTPTIISMTPDEEINWHHVYPIQNSLGVGTLNLSEFQLADNGDILVCSDRNRRSTIGDGYDIHVARYTADGEELFSKYYNIPISYDPLIYHNYFASDITELEDGSLVVSGSAFHHDKIVLLRLDSDGCIEDFECNEEVILSSNSDVIDLRLGLHIFPNPTSGMITLELPKEAKNGKLKILNNLGQQLFVFNIDQVSNNYQLDFTSYSSGIYHLQYLSFENNKIYISKMMVK